MRDFQLLIHFIGLIFGAGTGFALFVIGFLAKRFPEASRIEVIRSLYPLRYISYIGLLLLLASGVLLALQISPVIYGTPLFITKMLAVSGIILLSLYGFWQMKFTNGSNIAIRLKRLGFAGKFSFALSIVAVFCAVYTFH